MSVKLNSNSEKENVFTHGIFSKQALKKIIVPLIIEQALMLTIGMFDTLMVSFAGESAVSGVSLVDTINTLIIYLLTALATGGAIVAGQYLGSKNSDKSNVAGKQLLIASLFISIFFMTICVLFNKQLLSIYGDIDDEVINNAKIYFYITAISFPFISIYSSVAALFRAMGNTRIAMLNSLIMNIINIIGNAIFIYCLHLGAFGVALSTLISRIIAALSIVIMIRNKKLPLSIRSYAFWNIDIQMIKSILRISIPASLENSVFQIGRIVLASLIATFGTTAIAANAVTGSLINVATIPGQALGLALTTVVAQCIGAKEFKQAEQYTSYLLKLSWIFMIALNAFTLLLLTPILKLYNLSESTLSLSFNIMILHIVGWVTVWPMSFTLPNAFRAAGDVKYPMVISAISMIVFRIGSSYLLAFGMGLGALSVWYGMLMDWTFRCICFFIRWKNGKWKQYTVI